MLSIKVKLFSEKKKNNSGRRQIFTDPKELESVKDKFPDVTSGGNQKNVNKSGSRRGSEKYNNSKTNSTNTGEIKQPELTNTPTTNQSGIYSIPKSKDNKFQELINRYKTDPDFKKKVKTGGYITLGTALTAGAIIGGTKLIKNKKKKKDNEKIKNDILLDESNNKEDKK